MNSQEISILLLFYFCLRVFDQRDQYYVHEFVPRLGKHEFIIRPKYAHSLR